MNTNSLVKDMLKEFLENSPKTATLTYGRESIMISKTVLKSDVKKFSLTSNKAEFFYDFLVTNVLLNGSTKQLKCISLTILDY